MTTEMKISNVLCIGAGFVGGPTMAVMADRCPEIRFTVVDANADRIRHWNSEKLPVFEPSLGEIIARVRDRNLFFQEPSPNAIAQADLVFVSVNTPTKQFGDGAGMAADLGNVEACAREIFAHARNDTIVVEKSTVPVRTAETISRILHPQVNGRRFHVLSNPEFLAEGSAVADLQNPDRVLIGHAPTRDGKSAAKALVNIYRRWVPRRKILLCGVWSSELSKLTANAMLAQRVSSINSISAICEKTEADVGEISRAIGMDSRIGEKFLEAGVGFGGSCFRKDLLDLVYICGNYGLHEVAAYWQTVLDINDFQTARFARMIVEKQFNTVAGKKVAVFGFAFKPETNDTRDSPAIQVCRHLLEERAELTITDPRALENAEKHFNGRAGSVRFEPDPYRAAHGAHAVVLLTHWPLYKELDYERIFAGMTKPAFFFDGRRYIDPKTLWKLGFNVYPIGAAPHTHI
ncbi:MAG: nucleotide sugar dehydrogenase [bacterium]